jgi:hypothetical protein
VYQSGGVRHRTPRSLAAIGCEGLRSGAGGLRHLSRKTRIDPRSVPEADALAGVNPSSSWTVLSVAGITNRHPRVTADHSRSKKDHPRMTNLHSRSTNGHSRMTNLHSRMTGEHARMTKAF